MSKKIIKVLTLVLALAMILGLAACGNSTPADNTPADNTPADNTPADNTPADKPDEQPAEDDGDKLAVEVWDYDPADYYEDSEKIYNELLSGYYENYQAALSAKTVAERFALEAIAEAKLLDSAIMLPTTTRGGNYAISRVAPKTANSTLWGNDSISLMIKKTTASLLMQLIILKKNLLIFLMK